MNENILSRVELRWHEEFQRFVQTGDADPNFLKYLDENKACQNAVDEALAHSIEESVRPFAELGRVIAEKTAPAGRAQVPEDTKPARSWWSVTLARARRRLLHLLPATCALVFLVTTVWLFSRQQRAIDRVAELEAERTGGVVVAANGTPAAPSPAAAIADARKTIKRVPAQLESKDEEMFRSAVGLLIDSNTLLARALPILQDRKKTETQEGIRAQIELALGQLEPRDEGGTAAFTVDLKKEVPRLWQAVRMGKRDAEMALLSDSATVYRWAAVLELRKLGAAAKDAVPTLLDLSKTDEDPTVREGAAKALAWIDPDAAARSGVGRDLLDTSLLVLRKRQLKDPAVDKRLLAARELARMGPGAATAVPELRDAYQQEKDPSVRRQLAETLKAIDLTTAEQAGVWVSPAEKNAKLQSRQAQAYKVAVDAALFGLEDEDPAVREDAARVFYLCGPVAKDSFPALLKAWQSESNDRVRPALEAALKKVDAEAAEKAGMR
jgi:HEAT repeat protein